MKLNVATIQANRNFWEFEYSVDNIAKAAMLKSDYHHTRLEWWKAKEVETIHKIQADGVEIDKSLLQQGFTANTMASFSNVNYRQASVSIKDEYLNNLNECQSKIREHEGKLAGYTAWVKVLTSQEPSDTLSLTHDDWMYFFGK